MKTTLPEGDVIDLSGPWRLRDAGQRVDCPMSVPGDVHSALLDAGIIADPYYADNEETVQWVGETEWVLERTVDVPPALLDASSVYLHADTLDTLCNVTINGHEAGTARNRFRRHCWEVKPFLRPGANVVILRFHSAPAAMRERAAALPYPVPCSMHGPKIPHWNLLRKPMCHAGWDWGIALQVIAVMGDLSLRATRTARIEHVYTRQTFEQDGRCQVEIFVEAHAPETVSVSWRVEFDGQTRDAEDRLTPGINLLSVSMCVDHPRRWWPHGAGEQPLYELRVTVGGETVTRRIGLRALEIVTTPDHIGRPLTIRVNGIDIFCKGANWIPTDALPARQTPARARALIASARVTHMNILRVWGGGQYEDDAFYEACDEAGLLVWQDCMFACAMYPADQPFLEEVAQELEFQGKRLRDHPCLALWCGDNECIGALQWFEEPRKNRDRYLLDWDRLNTVRADALARADPTRTYWPSSPCAGPGDFADTFHADGSGDMHYWAVWHEGKSFDAYYSVRPRFCSEFGYQSFPSLETVRTFCPPDEFNVTAPVMEFHQRNDAGNRRIVEMFSRYFRLPVGFEQTLYLSQVQQAWAIKTAVEWWRTLRPECMGTIYWQLNNVWPGASWSSLEYGGKWKQLHHHARRFYAPVTACFLPRGETVELWTVNDGAAVEEWTARVELWTFAGEILRAETLRGSLAAGAAALMRRWNVADLTPTPRDQARRFLNVEWQGGTNMHWFTEPKRCALAAADVQARASGRSVTLTTDKPAFFVWAETSGIKGEFDDNSITLLPGRPRTLTFAPVTGEGGLNCVPTIMHLAATG